MVLSLTHASFDTIYFVYTAFIYIIISGLVGLVLPSRNLLIVLICFELILLGISGLFVFYSIFLPDLLGPVVAFVLITLAGAESALGLALVMLIYRTSRAVELTMLGNLKGQTALLTPVLESFPYDFFLPATSVPFGSFLPVENSLSTNPFIRMLDVVLLVLPVLVAVAFTTLLERKVMAAMQRRVGPNVVGYLGLLQPFADGLKLLLKEPIIPRRANKVIFLLSPGLVLFLSLFVWFLIPFGPAAHSDFELGLLYLVAVNVLEIYGILLAGWASNSKYALLGGLRSTAQMVSYELAMSFIFLVIVLVTGSFNLTEIVYFQTHCWLVLPLLPLALVFFIAMLAETNRTPFDLPEAEAELVAGYNVEYSGMLFAFFFLGEYSNMLVLSTLFSLLFLGGWTLGPFFFTNLWAGPFILAMKTSFVLFSFVWVRATLPRYRYDQLMLLGWKVFLPFALSYFIFLVILLYFTGALPQQYDIFPSEMWSVLNT